MVARDGSWHTRIMSWRSLKGFQPRDEVIESPVWPKNRTYMVCPKCRYPRFSFPSLLTSWLKNQRTNGDPMSHGHSALSPATPHSNAWMASRSVSCCLHPSSVQLTHRQSFFLKHTQKGRGRRQLFNGSSMGWCWTRDEGYYLLLMRLKRQGERECNFPNDCFSRIPKQILLPWWVTPRGP